MQKNYGADHFSLVNDMVLIRSLTIARAKTPEAVQTADNVVIHNTKPKSVIPEQAGIIMISMRYIKEDPRIREDDGSVRRFVINLPEAVSISEEEQWVRQRHGLDKETNFISHNKLRGQTGSLAVVINNPAGNGN